MTKRKTRRYRWGLMDDQNNYVVTANSARQLAELIGTSSSTVTTGVEEGWRCGIGPYRGCRYAKQSLVPEEPECSAQKLSKNGIMEVLQRRSPCLKCGRVNKSGRCTDFKQCPALTNWVKNSLRAFRALYDIELPVLMERGHVE